MTEPADINVDELRRRARRRLVGAIVLALAAAVVVPMLLESDPKPLGESVAVKIPPVDEGKFVNRLSDGALSRPAEGPPPKSEVPTKEPRKSLTDAEKAVVSPAARAPKYDTQLAGDKSVADKSAAAAPIVVAPSTPGTSAQAKDAAPKAEPKLDAKAESKVEPKSEPKSGPEAEQKAEPRQQPKAESKADLKVEPKAEPKAEPRADAKAPAEAAPPASDGVPKDGFSVQLAAYSDDKGANALANRLKHDGYPAYTEPLKTSRGTLWRVRVGPYPTRETANGVRDKLKSEGQSGIVAASR